MTRAQTEVKLVHRGFILAWFCYLFLARKLNLSLRDVSASVFWVFCILAACAIVVGFLMRRKFFDLTNEALPRDLRKAGEFWKLANFMSFGCTMITTIYGAVLKIIGSDWSVPGILFGLGLGFLLLWRPRQDLAASR